MKYTYKSNYTAHLGITGDRQCIIPDQVADNQGDYDGRSFPVIVRPGWRGTGDARTRHMRVKLIGDDYDLNGSGTGDVVVRPLAYID